MKIKLLKSKIHRATVTDTCLDYEGSISIDVDLLKVSNIVPYEKVHVLNVTNGNRLETYAIPSSKKALQKAKWKASDLDLIEANEAFAAQACAVNKEMGWDPEIENVNGGSIAIGHPIGASGTRILTTLLHEMEKRDSKKGLATLCIGGGMGIATCLERK